MTLRKSRSPNWVVSCPTFDFGTSLITSRQQTGVGYKRGSGPEDAQAVQITCNCHEAVNSGTTPCGGVHQPSHR